jgi:hypothetical protein
MTANRIRVSGAPKQRIDVDGLLQAVLMIAEQQLRAQHAAEHGDAADDEDRRESA